MTAKCYYNRSHPDSNPVWYTLSHTVSFYESFRTLSFTLIKGTLSSSLYLSLSQLPLAFPFSSECFQTVSEPCFRTDWLSPESRTDKKHNHPKHYLKCSTWKWGLLAVPGKVIFTTITNNRQCSHNWFHRLWKWYNLEQTSRYNKAVTSSYTKRALLHFTIYWK